MEPQNYRHVGQPITRIDNRAKLTGRARFAEDIRLPDTPLEGVILHSPHAFARIRGIDTSRAERLPGVRAVVTAADLPDRYYGRFLDDEQALARELVRFAGDRVAGVAADTREIAREAAALIGVDYEVLEPMMDPVAAMRAGAAAIHPRMMEYGSHIAAKPEGGNVCALYSLARGEPDGAFGQCERVFEHEYRTEMVHHAYLEPHACLAQHNPDGSYTVWSSTQGPFQLKALVAQALGVPHNRVRLVGTEIGGGFGGKIPVHGEVAAAVLARKAGRPVRIVMTREEDFLCGTPRAGFQIRIKTGVSKQGKLVARTIDVVLDGGAYAIGGVLMCSYLPQFGEGPYRIPNLRITARCVYTNKPPSTSFRAPGGPQMHFAVESETDRICHEMGWNAVEFRRQNFFPEGHVSLAGAEMRSVRTRETLDAALKLSGFDGAQTRTGKHRGRGLAVSNWNVGGLGSGAVVKLNEDGSASLLTGVVDLTGLHTSLAQIVAEVLDLPLEQVTVTTLDTESAPHSTIAAGSQALKSMGDAALKAAVAVREQLFERAVEALDAPPGRMELAEGQVRVKGEPGRTVPVSRLVAKALESSGPIVGQGSTGMYRRTPSCAAQVAEVEVDADTGQVKLLRYCAAQDVGRAINPLSVHGQVQGAVAQGIGMALSEGLIFREGRVANAGFLDYKIPSALDLPPIESVLVEAPAEDGPFGAKGVGEPPIVPAPAAIANAIFNAVGVRVTSLPITPEKLRRAMLEQRNAGSVK